MTERLAQEAITICPVCGLPVCPRTQAEYDACESLGVHLGDCWLECKREAARTPMRRRLSA